MEMENNSDRECGGRPHGVIRHILPFLVIPLGIGLVRGVLRHKMGHMMAHRRAEWKNGVPPMFAEMHRRAHEAEAAEAVAQAAKPAETQA
jgi:hypothetical protein